MVRSDVFGFWTLWACMSRDVCFDVIQWNFCEFLYLKNWSGFIGRGKIVFAILNFKMVKRKE